MNNVFKTLTTILVLMCSFIANAAWTVRYQHTDTLGSVIAESNSQGTITQRFDYKPFGEGTPTQKAGVGYTGHLEDTDLGLTYMQQRYYDPVIGRFYSNDPIGFRDTHSFNRYSYVGNNPYKYTDPTGMTRESSYQRCEDDPFCENLIPQGGSTSGKGAAAGAVVGGVVGTAVAAGCDIVTTGICTAGNPAIITGALALGAVTGDAIERAYTQLDRLISKMISGGPTEYQYALVANASGFYTNVRGGLTFLNAGEVYKYGTTNDFESRYSKTELNRLNVNMIIQFRGSRSETLVAEKIRLIEYAKANLRLPPGNRIFK